MALSNAEKCRRYRSRHGVESVDTKLDTIIELLQTLITKVSTPSNPNGSFDKKESNKERIKSSLTPLFDSLRESHLSNSLSQFDRWWEAYPEKVGKGAARKAFERALSKTSLDQLITALERYKTGKPPDRPWCNPTTWLNQERWNDVFTNGHDHDEPAHVYAERRARERAEIEAIRARMEGNGHG